MTKMVVIVTKVVLRQPTELVTFKESPNSAWFSVLEWFLLLNPMMGLLQPMLCFLHAFLHFPFSPCL